MRELEVATWDTALTEFQSADQQDPRVLYNLALIYQAQGDQERARELGNKAADFNGLHTNYAFVRGKAQEMLAAL